MICVSCGSCCKTMSPINGGYCPLLIEKDSPTGKIYLCGDYKNRPEECVKHSFPAPVCPIGADSLGINDQQRLLDRMEAIDKALHEAVDEDVSCEF